MKRVLVAISLSVLAASGCSEPVNPNGDAGVACDAGFTACDGTCVSLALDDNHCGACAKSCAATDTCAARVCYPRACPDTACTAAQACVNGACTEKLCVGVQCPSDSTCFGGKCLPRACGASTCDVGFVCQNDVCVDSSCLGINCPTGRHCLRGVCSTDSCTDGVVGSGETDVDCGGACPQCADGKACNVLGDCQSGVCTNRVCVACSSTSDCAAGKACVLGVCGACTMNAQCVNGQACVSGACVACTSSTQCTSGQVCVSGVCSACTSNTQCANGQACVSGVCGACTANAQCGTGACINGACGPCTLPSQCSAGQTCLSSACAACTPISMGSPSIALTRNTQVDYVATYSVLTDTATIILAPSHITFDAPGITGCTAAISGTGFARTIGISGCTGTGPVRFSIAPATALTTAQVVACDATSATFQLDQSGPTAVSSIVLGGVPQSLGATPTLTYAAATDVGGSTVARYEVQVIKDSDSSVVLNWTTHTSGTAITAGLALAANTAYHFNVRGVDALGNVGTQATSPAWTSANALFLTISANTLKYNLYTAAMAAGWTAGLPINVTINSGVVVYSDAVATPAFSYGALPTSTPVTIVNNGSIFGGRAPPYVDKSTNQAWEGGPALQISAPTTLINNGAIVGGVGNGGANDGDSCGGCGGGNGGSAGGQGGPAIVCSAALTVTNTGTVWGGGGGGGSGGGGFNAGVGSGPGGNGAGASATMLLAFTNGGGAASGQVGAGGNGGDYGLPGAAGGAGTNGPGAAGPGGYALVLNGNMVTFNGAAVAANASYTTTTWIAGTKGRVAP